MVTKMADELCYVTHIDFNQSRSITRIYKTKVYNETNADLHNLYFSARIHNAISVSHLHNYRVPK